MELPHIGEHCHESSCNQLDFLPVKCDGCKKNFCNDHWTYQGHNCASPRLKDVQVPVCPMCDKPVPSKPGSNPNEAVSRHLDQDCNSGRKRNPRCSKPKCKTRELIKVDCDQCGLNFCLKHRFPLVNIQNLSNKYPKIRSKMTCMFHKYPLKMSKIHQIN